MTTWSRKTLKTRLVAGVIVLQLITVEAAASSEQEVRIDWVVPQSRLTAAKTPLQSANVKTRADTRSGDNPTKGLPLLYVIAGLVLLPDLAKGLIAEYKDWKYGTTIIRCTGAASCRIDHDPQGKPDTVVIKDDSNIDVSVYQDRSSFDSAKWIDVLVKAMTVK
jgi:hypothetical protein